jgi:hypothetical protein
MINLQIQDEITEAIGTVVVNKIVDRANFFSILCDKITNRNTIEQITVCTRYVNVDKYNVWEDILRFIKIAFTIGIPI